MIGKTNALFLIDSEPGEDVIYNFDFTGSKQTFTFEPGLYVLECWGASGGYRNNSSYGGRGGYSAGTLVINSSTIGYIYVGGSGISTNSSSRRGFNGGGQAGYSSINGGGASDIRIGTDSLYARVIVAGGGGSCGANNKQGGAGGGSTALSATNGYGRGGKGGTQTLGGNEWGSFGEGGSGSYHSRGYGGGGGGGWYGGGGTYPNNSADDDKGGGGGSGWVYTKETYTYWAKNSTEGKSGIWLLDDKYYLTDTQNICGNKSFLSPTGTNETGHNGNGYVRITRKNVKQYKLQLIGIFNGQSILISRTDYPQGTTIDISDLPDKFENYKVKDKLWYSDSSCTNLISEDFIFNRNRRIYCKLIEALELNFEYTGNVQSTSLSAGKYILECWGAQGGISGHSLTNFGKGGYAKGILDISNRTNLFIYVGGKGENGSGTTTTPLGGFNGGGSGGQGKNDNAGGGGASDIRINTDSLYSRVIVAGGAGGNGCSDYIGGSGGGTSGTNGYGSTNYGEGGSAGTQRSGGISNTRYATSGSFGVGGGAIPTGGDWGCGGGGGGWYGGASGQSQSGGGGSGGGGSGWIYTETTYNNWKTNSTEGQSGQWLLNSNYYLTSTELMSGIQTFNDPNGNTETGHSGNGYVRITKILE